MFLAFSYTPFCPFDFYKTEPFISSPLLSVLNSRRINPNVAIGQIGESRSFSNGIFGSFNTDYTRDNASISDELDNSIRLASLPMVARNIFNDIFVQRISAFGRFLRLATNVLST